MNDENFSSFWEHYRVAHQWLKNYNSRENEEDLEEEKENEISAEMIEFRRITMEHRQQR